MIICLPYMLESAIMLVSLPQSGWQTQLEQLQDAQGKISLKQLLKLKRPPLVGIELNRSNGDQIDAVLLQHQGHPAIYTRSSAGEFVGSMLPMLHKGFVDLMLEYPKIAARSSNALRYWPLTEAEPYNAVHFASSRTPQGEKIAMLLNHSIRALTTQQQYQQLLMQPLAADERRQGLQYWLQALAIP